MTPYETERKITTGGANEIVEIPLPGRCTITRIASVELAAAGAQTLTFYNRVFVGPTVAVRTITDAGDGTCLIETKGVFAVKVGDAVTVAGSSAGAYNAVQRVTEIVDEKHVITDKSYTVDATGGTVGITIPAAEQDLYKVASLTGTGVQESLTERVFVNLDPQPNLNRGFVRKIYVKVLAAGSYKVAIRCHENIGTGG